MFAIYVSVKLLFMHHFFFVRKSRKGEPKKRKPAKAVDEDEDLAVEEAYVPLKAKVVLEEDGEKAEREAEFKVDAEAKRLKFDDVEVL